MFHALIPTRHPIDGVLGCSWVVRRVTYEDRYDITLEADFETNVPIPVVTIKPQELDLDILQRGLMPLINFELTNHGLIRADNVNFKLPDVSSHPFIHLEMVRLPRYYLYIGKTLANMCPSHTMINIWCAYETLSNQHYLNTEIHIKFVYGFYTLFESMATSQAKPCMHSH